MENGGHATGDGRRARAPPTIQVIYRYVGAIFRAAVADRLIVESPCAGVRLPKIEPRTVVPPTTDNVSAMRDTVADRYRALVTLGAGTGLRQGEAFAIEAEHIDFLRRTLRVCQQLVLMPREAPKIAPLKTETSYRTIPLPGVAIDALAAHMVAFPPVTVELGDVTGPASRRRPAQLVFTDDNGQALRRTAFSLQVWQPARKMAGLPSHFTYHNLLYYYASLLIRHGESVRVVQSRLGHATATETLDTYSHLWPDAEDRTRQAIDSVLGAPADQVRTTIAG